MPEENNFILNRDIRARFVRFINESGEQVGVISISEALSKAEEAGLDLVQINTAVPPVCKLMNYSKYKFEQKKKLKESKKKQAVIEIKEVQLSQTIEIHDLQTKARQVEKFLSKGDHVRITLMMRGRENNHPEVSKEVLQKFLDLLTENEVAYKIKSEIKIQGKIAECSVCPLK